jgi:peptide/nickel transport system substrate-binding protein
MTGFVRNSRRARFDDWRVRAALIQAFNFEFTKSALTGGAQPRITSYFSNPLHAMEEGQAKGRTAELLTPFAADKPRGLMEGYLLLYLMVLNAIVRAFAARLLCSKKPVGSQLMA